MNEVTIIFVRALGRAKSRSDGLNRLLKNRGVICMRQQVAVVQHIDPNLAVGDNLRDKGILENLPRGYRRDANTTGFQEILDRLPGQLKGILKPLNDAFL